MSKVVIVDYGIGNLFSVSNAFRTCGAEITFSRDPHQIMGAERLVLPGVGAFQKAMESLRTLGLVDPITQFAQSGKPFMGICLGLQMLMQESDEFGVHRGLGLIGGRVESIPSVGSDGKAHKIPHIGWNELRLPSCEDREDTLLEGLPETAAVYFVHSYMAMPKDERHRLADCFYHGIRIAAVVRSGNLYGCQFHPEKSGPVGLRILHNFLKLNSLMPSSMNPRSAVVP